MEITEKNNPTPGRRSPGKKQGRYSPRLVRAAMALFLTAECLILLMLLLFRVSAFSYRLRGTWTVDGSTSYRFERMGTGALVTPLDEYAFHYSATGNSVELDFDDDGIETPLYHYSVSDGTLTLESENGAQRFVLTRTK